MAVVKWSGMIDGQTYRVVDAGAGANPRLTVEQRAMPDRMGVARWSDLDPIPRATFEAMLIAAGVVT